MGNFSGLAAARHQVLSRAGWDVEGQGLFGAPEIRVVVGAEVHASLLKALGLLGLGRERVVTIPVDRKGRMRADALEPRFLDGPTIVCLQAGNVNTGAFDPIREIAPRAREAGAWVHVDGAFGLWAAVSPHTRHFTEGIDEVDSIATDLHKWLNVPYDSGLALYRDPAVARAALAVTAAYLPQTDERTPSDFTPEASRRARGIDIWAALLSLGRGGQDLVTAAAARTSVRLRSRSGRIHDPERGRAEPGAGLVRRRREDENRDPGSPARRHLLVRRLLLARQGGDADQRLLLGDDGGGRGAESRRHRPRRQGSAVA
jgi:glutamate/tyrosine decarboxylase-like PLP-dependent enzyme